MRVPGNTQGWFGRGPRDSLRSVRITRPSARGHQGQATVELVALLPLLALLGALLWQVALAGHATWAAGAAARAAARAHAVDGDPRRAARLRLPTELKPGLEVRTASDGTVRVSVRIPTLTRRLRLGHASATARFEPQGA